MKSRSILVACGLALSAGCSGSSQNNSAPNAMPANEAGTSAAASAAPAGPTGEAGFRQLAECAATMEALSRLYDVLASGEQGARAEEMRRMSSARSVAALDYEMSASTLGMSFGKTQADVERIKRERHAAMERERARQPDFGEFAIWLGRESDRCVAAAPPRG